MSVTEQDKPATKRSTRQVVDDLADGENIKGKKPPTSDDERLDALEWFLATEDDTDLSHSFEINVGGPEHRKWITWTVQPVDMDRLRRIRQRSQPGNRRDRRRAEQTGQAQFDEVAANIAIVVEGTVEPDLRDAARRRGTAEPSSIIRARFAHKPGLLAQIAAEIMSISGYDDDDVREVDAAQG